MKHSKNSRAFSLIELAIVGLVISILIAGIIQGQVLVTKSRIANARSLIVSSPVASMDGLVAWYETTLEKSFSKAEAKEGQAISTWYDLNPNIITVRNNANQSTTANKPIYREKTINNLPIIEFTRSNSTFLSFDGSQLANSNYTLFFVEQRTSNDTNNYFMGGSDATLNTSLVLGYRNDTTITISYSSNGMDHTSFPAYTAPTAQILSYSFNHVNKKLYRNGSELSLTHIASGAEEDATTLFNDAALGNHRDLYYYQGNLGEVILFNKYLNTEDRKAVEHYLSKKWGIDVS